MWLAILMGLLYVGNSTNQLLLPDETLALVHDAIIEASKITGFVTVCSWFEEKSRYAAVDAAHFFPGNTLDNPQKIDDGTYILGLKAVFDHEPAPKPDPEAIEQLADLMDKHDGWLILDKNDNIITDTEAIKHIKVNALRHDAWSWLDQFTNPSH